MRTVLSVGTGVFKHGVDRLRKALNGRENCLLWYDELPPGPTHQEIPFGFKLSAVDYVLAQGGLPTVLWCDSSIVPIKPLDDLWALIEEQGYWFSQNYNYTTGQFCCDSALGPLDVTSDQAFSIPLVIAGAFGLDFRHQIAQDFYKEWRRMMLAGAFNGPLYGNHRHDQTAASVAAWKVGMKLTQPPKWIVEDFQAPIDETVLSIQRIR